MAVTAAALPRPCATTAASFSVSNLFLSITAAAATHIQSMPSVAAAVGRPIAHNACLAAIPFFRAAGC
jgi:hypothetical protein